MKAMGKPKMMMKNAVKVFGEKVEKEMPKKKKKASKSSKYM